MKKNLKIVVIVLLIIAVVIGGYFVSIGVVKSTAKKKALEAIDEMFTALKSGNTEEIKKYINENDLDAITNDSEIEKTDSEATAMMISEMFKNLDYEVISIDAGFSECNVKLNVSNKDLKTVFKNYITKAFTLAFSQAFGGMSEDEMEIQLMEYFKEQYNSDEVEIVTTELVVEVKKESGKWKLYSDKQNIVNAILPGFSDVENTLLDITSEGEE